MQEKAKSIVVNYFNERVEKTDGKRISVEDVYIVGFCKKLSSWKVLLGTTVGDGMYYVVSYNGDTREISIDAYHPTAERAHGFNRGMNPCL